MSKWGRPVLTDSESLKMMQAVLALETRKYSMQTTNDEKSTFTFEDAIAFVSGELAVAA